MDTNQNNGTLIYLRRRRRDRIANLIKLVNKLNPYLKDALENAVGEAMKRRSAVVEPAHWIFHVLFNRDMELMNFLEEQGIDRSALHSEFEAQMPYGASAQDTRPTISGSLSTMLERAWTIASIDFELRQVLPEILLFNFVQPNALGFANIGLNSLSDLSLASVRSLIEKRVKLLSQDRFSDALSSKSGATLKTSSALAQFTVNLTQMARRGELDPVVGRSEEIFSTLDVLLRRRQNNPILLGQPGVGKTAIVEGLAQKIIINEVPDSLKNIELLALDMGLLQAGAKLKGEFEERLKNVLQEVKSTEKPPLIFIDEAHSIIGAGGTEGQNDAANLLKPALARGEFRTIAATTLTEYKKYFEKDPALSRRFQPIIVNEPKTDVAINILRTVADNLSKHHGVLIREAAIKMAVDLSVRFMSTRKLPDKAISVMDTACARVALSHHCRPQKIQLLEEELKFAEMEVEGLTSDSMQFGGKFGDSQKIEKKIAGLKFELEKQTKAWLSEKKSLKSVIAATRASVINGENGTDDELKVTSNFEFVQPWVTTKTVAEVVADLTHVPASNLESSEAQRLIDLGKSLKKRVIGQDFAVDSIVRSLKISRAGLTDVRKPIGCFLMCGPSGVGKTETALAIADQFFGGEEALTTINMTEFKEAHKASMLLGASAGYVGYGKGGVLTEAIRQKPYSVLLLDEMEKAHPAIHDIFFQIFDKGEISDSEGNRIDFRNTIIIMTSNAGGESLKEFVHITSNEKKTQDWITHIRSELLDFFSPAFLGRTELIFYRPLTNVVSEKIVHLYLDRIKIRVQEQHNARLEWSPSFVKHVIQSNNDPLSGGRALEKIINNGFLPKLAEECINRVISGEVLRNIYVGFNGAEMTLDIS